MFENVVFEELFNEGWFLFALFFLYEAYDFLFDDVSRNPPIETQRVDWEEHRRKLIYRGHFHRTYRMSPESFDKLILILKRNMTLNEVKAYARSTAGPIIPEIRLHCVLRYLAGGSYLDILTIVSIPQSTFYYLVWKTCEAINDCEELAFKLPSTPEELHRASAGFESISTEGIMYGCIGAIDGWLCCIEVPPSNIAANISTFFSGHYQRYGINVQVITDHLGRFIYMAVAAPGGQPDINALGRTSLHNILRLLPLGYFIIGDNAYPPSEYLIPIFGGAQRLLPGHDDTNYYKSQCRIRVEMALGMMTNRFRILNSPLRISPFHVRVLMQTVARLHNYCLNENNNYESVAEEDGVAVGRVLATPLPQAEEIGRETRGEVPAQPIIGVSIMRKKLVERVVRAGLKRPLVTRPSK